MSIDSRRFKGKVRAVQIDLVGRTMPRIPFPLPDNPMHEARVVCNVSVLNEQVHPELTRSSP